MSAGSSEIVWVVWRVSCSVGRVVDEVVLPTSLPEGLLVFILWIFNLFFVTIVFLLFSMTCCFCNKVSAFQWLNLFCITAVIPENNFFLSISFLNFSTCFFGSTAVFFFIDILEVFFFRSGFGFEVAFEVIVFAVVFEVVAVVAVVLVFGFVVVVVVVVVVEGLATFFEDVFLVGTTVRLVVSGFLAVSATVTFFVCFGSFFPVSLDFIKINYYSKKSFIYILKLLSIIIFLIIIIIINFYC